MTFRALLLLIATAAFVVSPYLSDSFGGFRPEQYPVPQDNPPIQPATYAFAIWGLIYAWLLLSALFGLLARRNAPGWDAARWPLILSMGLGAFWIELAGISPAWATLLIWVMLLTALAALFRTPREDRWLLQAPVAIYAGWLTAASFVSLGLVAAGYGLLPQGAAAWIALALALAFAGAVQTALGRAPEYAAAVIWALVALAVRNWGADWGLVALSALGVAVLAALAAVARGRAAETG